MLNQNKTAKDVTSLSYHGRNIDFQAEVIKYAASEDNTTRIAFLNLIPNSLIF